MTLTKYGRREWMAISLIALVAACVSAFLSWWWALIPIAFVWAALVSFFRDPVRPVPRNLPAGVFLSPADGTVSAVFQSGHHEAVGGPATVIRIFLSLLNVHINRSPCEGVVESITHHPGEYLDARTAESAEVNESNLMTLRTDEGLLVGVRQVSGAVARRIVCVLKVGDRLTRGQKFGMIKFGSTTELILPQPDRFRVHVSVGEPVRAGLTQLATLMQAAHTSDVKPVRAMQETG